MSGLSQPLAATKNAKAGTVTIFEAPVGTAYDATTWQELGCLEPGSFNADFPKEFHDIKTGTPETIKASFVVGLDGKVNFELIEYTGKAVEVANGGENSVRLFGSTPVSTTADASSTVTLVKATSAAGLAVGDVIEVAGLYETYIQSISTNDLTVYPALPVAPSTSDTIKKVFGWKQAVGGANIRERAYRIIFAATDGSQAVILMPRARAGSFKPAYPHKAHVKLPVELACYGTQDNTLNPAAPVVAYHYILLPGATI